MIEKGFGERFLKVIMIIMLIIVALTCVIPFIVIISASFSTEDALIKQGYSILPRMATLDAYKVVFKTPGTLIGAYWVTIITTAAGSAGSVLLVALSAYPLSRKDFKWKNIISFYMFFTMLFNGGAVSNYLLIAKYLNMRDTLAALIFPLLFSVWNMFLLRTYFSKVSPSIIEAAKIDGAGEYRIFFTIVWPMTQTGIATVLLLSILAYWNDWYQCLMYMPLEEHITLQYYLYRILSNINELQKSGQSVVGGGDYGQLPKETVRMAMCVLAAGPMLAVFMFFQKYFVKGISVGGVKG